MSLVTITNAEIKNANPSTLFTPFILEITFRCTEDLQVPLVWKLIYVGSPESKEYDQLLEQFEIGPIRKGTVKFNFQAEAPNFKLVDKEYIHGTTILLLEVSYKGQEFIRIGWYIHNAYTDPVLEDDPPEEVNLQLMQRYIVVDQPRLTKFSIDWNKD